MTVVGFTGSQHGATPEQLDWLRERLVELRPVSFRHGDCIGADEHAHAVALSLRIPVVIHPPVNPAKRAFCPGGAALLPPDEYLARNRAIVDASDVLLALPDGPERLRSGTWSTVRYARRQGKRVEVRMP